MSLLDIPIDKIALSDLIELKSSSTSESRSLEFKQRLSVMSDDEKIKFLATVSAFANTEGGTIVYGVTESNGIATAIPGWTVQDQDKFVLTLENLCRDSIEPRLHDLRMKIVPIRQKNVALVIRVPRSYRRPHVVRYNNHWRFYGRNSAGRYPLDVNEVRSIIVEGASTTEKLRNLRQSRIESIMTGESPLARPVERFAVIHIIPFESLFSDFEFDWSRITDSRVFLPPFGGSGHNYGFNSDGYVTFSGRRVEDGGSYLQLFRNGMVETTDVRILEPVRGEIVLPSFSLEQDLVRSLTQFRQAAEILNLSSPVAVMLSLVGASEARLGVEPGYAIDVIIRNNRLLFGPLILSSLDGDLAQGLRPMFDAIWNTGGHACSMNFDENGKWRGYAR